MFVCNQASFIKPVTNCKPRKNLSELKKVTSKKLKCQEGYIVATGSHHFFGYLEK